MTDEELQDLKNQITYLQEKQDLLVDFVYEFFYNHYELMNEDDLSRLNAIMKF